MNSIKIWNMTAPQAHFALPSFGTSTGAFGASVCGRVDATAVKHAAALIEAAPFGTSVWRPPSD